MGANDDSIAEFARSSDGSLAEIGCVADPSNDGTSTCATGTSAAGLVSPQAVVISVVVSDFVRHKTIVLHAGQSYLAPGRRRHR